MCGRYARYTTRKEFAKLAGLPVEELCPFGETIPSWNTSPGLACTLVRRLLDQPEAEMANLYWGFIPHWADERPGKPLINAKLETVERLPTWRRVFRFRRCLVAADGWYEWREENGQKQPYFLCYRDHRPFFFGGVWDEWYGPAGVAPTFAILTQPPVADIEGVHDRMPVIVPPENYDAWLDKSVSDASQTKELCHPPAPGDLMGYRVSRAVNRPDTNGPELIEQIS